MTPSTPRRLVSITALLAIALAARAAETPAPTLEPVADVAQPTRAEIKLALKAKGGDAPLKFAVARVRRNGRVVSTPVNLKLDADKGELTWTPTPSQAGLYELTVGVKDAKDRDATGQVKITVREREICTAQGPVGDLLRKWHAEGTAAGNPGDFYDNRDRDHSPLNVAAYPQLDMVKYTDDQLKRRADWAGQHALLDHVTFGNSSTSAGVHTGGSNIRHYYAHPNGLEFLYQQYRKNNLYIYPEHLDHDPGHNGKPGYGDLYPANSAYLIASQGSSGSDQPFMRALPHVLAAFRPEVKKRLTETGLLMPTVQLILRSSNKHITDPKEYLTGKAHPTVFEGAWVDELKMVQAAHAITADALPPMVQLKVVEEDEAKHGRDFYEPGRTETLCDSPASIARVVRGLGHARRMVVSAEDSFDANKKPLTWHWVVLRGDARRITIKPRNESASVVEIVVPYHGRYTVDAPVKIDTNRVDIGAFVHNGTHHSAAGFVTFFSLDSEARTYDESGRLLEIGYGAGTADLRVTDWKAVFDVLKNDETPSGRLLRTPFGADALAVLEKAGVEYREATGAHTAAQDQGKQANDARQKAAAALKAADDALAAARKAHDQKPTDESTAAVKKAEAARADADVARKKADDAAAAAQKATDAAAKAAEDVLTRPRDGLKLSVRPLIEHTLDLWKSDAGLYASRQAEFDALLKNADDGGMKRFHAARKRLLAFGILHVDSGKDVLRPVRAGDAPAVQRLTAYERNLLERFHAEALSAVVFPKFLTHSFNVNLVDPRIAALKEWRDVYRHDDDGTPRGWDRYDAAGKTEYMIYGTAVVARDDRGRITKAREVKYEYDGTGLPPFLRRVKPVFDRHLVHYEYDGPNDRKGRISMQEVIEDKK